MVTSTIEFSTVKRNDYQRDQASQRAQWIELHARIVELDARLAALEAKPKRGRPIKPAKNPEADADYRMSEGQ